MICRGPFSLMRSKVHPNGFARNKIVRIVFGLR
jgi:hypothetical protein